MTIKNQISVQRGTMGVREMPDGLDSGGCHLRDGNDAVVRVNLDGIYVSLCGDHKCALMHFMDSPLPPKAS